MRADIALIGYGNVARRFERLLDDRGSALERDFGLRCHVVATASRRHGCVAGGKACADAAAVIEYLAASDAELRVAVETTTLDVTSGEPAVSHVLAAIERGCHVITANKGPVAFSYHELSGAARRADVAFLFEGSVMDGVPVFNLVRETLPAVTVTAFEGVINTTTNHILAAMESGAGFEAALAQMQADGIAEADPSLDVDGWDAAAKTAALANVLLGARITPHDVKRTGISSATGAAARAARAGGRRLKLVASARSTPSGVVAQVELREMPLDTVLGGLGGGANALILETDLLDRIAICQLSGNLTQTAYALLTDLVTVARTYGPRTGRTGGFLR